jgi:UDP-N-acetyl-2-amino-2-deoxyglucuronate dehydrogenase
MTTHIGILGGGGISETHARAASEIEGVTVVAVAGTNPTKVQTLADRYGASAHTDVNAMLSAVRLDALLIGSPPAFHADAGIVAARAGVHVVTEKPLDITLAKCDALIEACASAKVKLGVFFQERFAPDLVRLKGAVDRGDFGRPILGSARVKWWRPAEYYGNSKWRGRQALDGGGAVMGQGIHTIDTLLWLFGDVTSVFARKTAAVHAIEVEDTLVATLEFASGALMTFEATTAAYPGYPRRMELTFEGGTISVEQDRVSAADLRTATFESTAVVSTNAAASSPVISDVRGHKAVIEDLLRAVKENGQPRCDGREGRRSVEVVEALYRSAATAQPVSCGTASIAAKKQIERLP